MKKYHVPIWILGGIVLSLLLIACAMAQSAKINLIKYAETGDLLAIEHAFKNGADLEQRDWRLRTPLMAATHTNQIQVARFLIEHGADVNAKDASLDSPYLYAGAKGLKEILIMTLTHGADLKSTNRYGGTALIPAAERGHVQVVQI
ncbi:ankyrin repeat domain-containing protein [Arsenophonus apicola]